MWTKGMIMVVTGISGIALTLIWAMGLLIIASKKKRNPVQNGERVVYTRPLSEHQGTGDKSPVKDTILLQDNMTDTDVL